VVRIPLSRCESCGRRAKISRGGDDDRTCDFCGGRLRQVWGLAQLARATHEAGPPQLYESQVREALYGRQEQAGSAGGGGSSPEHGEHRDDPVGPDPEQA
jgi:hypothetical protein